jgi:uncharacterized protein
MLNKMRFVAPSLFTLLFAGLVLDGIVFAQQSAADVSLNAQLLTGARNGDEALVRRALDAGAAPNSRNRTGDTALMFFIRKGNAAMVDLLLGKGADVNLRNLDRVSPLMTAAYHGHAGIARALLDRDADVAAADQLSKTAMVYAAAQGHSEIVGMLLAAGVDVNSTRMTSPHSCGLPATARRTRSDCCWKRARIRT